MTASHSLWEVGGGPRPPLLPQTSRASAGAGLLSCSGVHWLALPPGKGLAAASVGPQGRGLPAPQAVPGAPGTRGFPGQGQGKGGGFLLLGPQAAAPSRPEKSAWPGPWCAHLGCIHRDTQGLARVNVKALVGAEWAQGWGQCLQMGLRSETLGLARSCLPRGDPQALPPCSHPCRHSSQRGSAGATSATPLPASACGAHQSRVCVSQQRTF